jgi:hypothetical protein
LKFFSIEEAEAQIPRLEEIFGRIVQLRTQMRVLEAKRDRTHLTTFVELVREELDTVTAMGPQVKDLDTGLVDWVTRAGGREVLLCWRLGEKRVAYWHELDAGFAGRRPIEELPLD